MGNSTSKSDSVGNISSRYFSENEQAQLQKLFLKISGTSKNNKQSSISYDQFKLHVAGRMPDNLMEKLFDKMKEKSQDTVAFLGFANTLALLLKGTIEDQINLITYFVAQEGSSEITSVDVQKFVVGLCEGFFLILSTSSQFTSWQNKPSVGDLQEFANFICAELFTKSTSFDSFGEDGDKRMDPSVAARSHCATVGSSITVDYDLLEKWLTKCRLITSVMKTVFNTCFPVAQSTNEKFPFPSADERFKISSELSAVSILTLNSELPIELTEEWRQLFSTDHHGLSFSQMVSRILNKGPTIMVVKDNQNHIFGGFASGSWEYNANFQGNSSCFLFSISPRLCIYPATGFNNNYYYLNDKQQTLPNGLGFGGTLNYFGIWIDSDFGRGKCSPSCTTFSCPQLSGSPEFEIERVEFWSIGEDVIDAAEQNLRRRSSSQLREIEATKSMFKLINKDIVSAEDPDVTAYREEARERSSSK